MLPKINYPTYELKIPSTGKKVTFRPFLVREEKILLIAKQSEDSVDIMRAIKQVINNCCVETNFNVNSLTIFDIEYLFLKIRANSVNNIAKVSYRDNEDQKIYNFEIDLNQLEVKFPENIEKNIKVTENSGILMKHPPASIFDDKEFFKTDKDDSFYELVIKCMDKIYEEDEIHDLKDYPKELIEEYLDNLDVKTYQNIVKFMENTPKLYHKVEYTNQNGKQRIIEMTTLTDFFTLG
jgi:hypothetical protein